MKFGKEFEKQKVPEWTEAYVDYNGLKRILLEICRHKQNKRSIRATQQRLPSERAFGGPNQQCKSVQSIGDIEDQAVAVDNMQQEKSVKIYNTKFLLSPDDGGENELMFFRKLDDELNKVNTFYKNQVEEVTREATLMNKQVDTLIAFRIKVTNPDHDVPSSLRRLSVDISNSSSSKISSSSSPHTAEVNALGLSSESQARQLTDNEINETSFTQVADDQEHQAAPLDTLDKVKTINSFQSPISTVKDAFMDVKENDFKFNKEELKKVEEKLNCLC